MANGDTWADRAVSILCNCSETPPSVNSRPLLISRVRGNTDRKVSVPIMASVLRSHIRMGNSVCNSIALRNVREVDFNACPSVDQCLV